MYWLLWQRRPGLPIFSSTLLPGLETNYISSNCPSPNPHQLWPCDSPSNVSPGHEVASTIILMHILSPPLHGWKWCSPGWLEEAQIPAEGHPTRRSITKLNCIKISRTTRKTAFKENEYYYVGLNEVRRMIMILIKHSEIWSTLFM